MTHMITDSLLKLLFSNVRFVVLAVRGFVDEPWVPLLDLSRLRSEESRRVDSRLRQTENDRVWSAPPLDGATPPVFFIFEFESAPDADMPWRMMEYTGHLMRGLRDEGRLTGGRLPLVYRMVVHTGAGRWTAARSLEAAQVVPGGRVRQASAIEYAVLAHGETDLERPELAGNPLASMLGVEWLVRGKRAGAWRPGALLTAQLLDRKCSPDLRGGFLRRLEEWVPERYPGDSLWDLSALEGAEKEEWTKMQEVQNIWAEQLIQTGEKRAMERFLTSQRRMLITQADARFGDEVAASVGEFLSRIADPDRLADIGIRIAACETGEALLDSLDGAGV